MRQSFQRDTIRNIVKSTKCHPTADWIYSQARKLIPNISLGTVYRNLSHLDQSGVIKAFKDDSITRYDGNTKPHHHLKCFECGGIKDVDLHDLNLNKHIKSKFDFEPIEVEITVFGKCKKHT